MIVIEYNTGVNVPAARTVAERPSPVTWRYNVWHPALLEIGPQVAPHNNRFRVSLLEAHCLSQFKDLTKRLYLPCGSLQVCKSAGNILFAFLGNGCHLPLSDELITCSDSSRTDCTGMIREERGAS